MVLDVFMAWAGVHPLMFHLIIIFLSLVVIIKAADLIVFGITAYSKQLGISDFLIGSLIIGMGTALPEFVSSMMGGAAADSGIVFGTILGSNVITVTLVMGVLAIVGKNIKLNNGLMKKVKPYLFPIILLPYLFAMDGELSRGDGMLLIGVFIAYVLVLWKAEGKFGKLKHTRLKHLWQDGLVFLGSLVALLLAARWLVFSSIISSKLLGIPSYLLAITVIGIAASLGDLAVEIKSIIEAHAQIAFGTVIGGLVLENTLILGLVSLFFPLSIAPLTILLGVTALALPLAYLLYINKGILTKKTATGLVICYVVFLLAQILILT